MALSKKDLQELGNMIESAIKRAVGAGRRVDNHYKATERRLYRYPILKRNIEEYKADIEDIKREDLGKSKSIVKFSIHGGDAQQEDIEEKRQKLITNLQNKIASDSFEVQQIEGALERIRNHPYCNLISVLYFEQKTIEEATDIFGCVDKTITRNRKALVNLISDVLYGADEAFH